MPVAEKKCPKKPKRGSERAAPPPPPVNLTVKDCMVWPEPVAKGRGKGAKKGAGPDTKPNVYRSTLVRRDKTADQLDDDEGPSKTYPPPPQRTRRDEGTVIEALRGWPGSREPAEDDARDFEVTVEAANAKAANPKPGKKNSKKKKGKKEEEVESVYIGDVIHQKYLNEYLEKRRREMEREQRRKDDAAYAGKAGRRAALERSNKQANRTSQLRSIAVAEKARPSPVDLWKMPRFTRGAQPRLATKCGGDAGTGRSDQSEADNGVVSGEGCDGGGVLSRTNEGEGEIQHGDASPMATN